MLISGSDDGFIRLWKVHEPKETKGSGSKIKEIKVTEMKEKAIPIVRDSAIIGIHTLKQLQQLRECTRNCYVHIYIQHVHVWQYYA